ncbi:MAG: AAA family ATPase [Acidobacteria bacterium]|nr:AAA family ATPase [Acidobacteriota bacterium]
MPAVILAGLPGTGKSTLAAALAERLNGHVLNKDVIRHAIFGPAQVHYSSDQDDLIQQFMVAAAAFLWQTNPNLWILFDGRTFSKAAHRKAIPPHHTILCTAPESSIRERLMQPHLAANRTWQLYEQVREQFEPIVEPHLILDTSRPLHANLELALSYLTK